MVRDGSRNFRCAETDVRAAGILPSAIKLNVMTPRILIVGEIVHANQEIDGLDKEFGVEVGLIPPEVIQ